MKQNKSYSSHQNQKNLKKNIYIENMAEDNEYISSNTNRENEFKGGREEEIQYYTGDYPEENALEYKINHSNQNNLYTNSYPNFNLEQNQINYCTYQGNIANNLNQNEDRKNNIHQNEIFNEEENIYNDNLGEVYQKNIIQRVNYEKKNDFKIQGMNMKIENNYLKKSIKEDRKNDIINEKMKEKRNTYLLNEKEKNKNFVDIIKNKINNKLSYKSKNNENVGNQIIEKEVEKEKEKEIEMNEDENYLKDSLNESNDVAQNKYMENEKLVLRGKINSHTNSAKIYLNNNAHNDYKTVSSEKISFENYNDSNLHYFNPTNNLDNDSNINDNIIDNVGKKEITKLKYKYYKNMNNLNEYNMNDINNNYEYNNNDLDMDIDNNIYSKRVHHQSDIVQDIINRYKFPVTYNFNTLPARKNSEKSNKRNIPVNKISAVYQKYNKQKNKKYINMSNSNNLITHSLKNKKTNKNGVNTYVSSKSVNCIKQTNSNDLSDININNKINNSYNYSNNNNIVGNSSIKKTNIYHKNLSSKSKKDSYTSSDNINMGNINNPEFNNAFQYNSNFNTLISFDNKNNYFMNRKEEVIYPKYSFNLDDDENYVNKVKPITFNDLNMMENENEKINKLFFYGQEINLYLKQLQLKYNILKHEFNQLLNIKKKDFNKDSNNINIIYENNQYQKDQFKDFLLKENNTLKNEIKNYEDIIIPLIKYINDINDLFNTNKIEFLKIKEIIKDHNHNQANKANNQFKNFVNILNDSKNEITRKVNNYTLFQDNKLNNAYQDIDYLKKKKEIIENDYQNKKNIREQNVIIDNQNISNYNNEQTSEKIIKNNDINSIIANTNNTDENEESYKINFVSKNGYNDNNNSCSSNKYLIQNINNNRNIQSNYDSSINENNSLKSKKINGYNNEKVNNIHYKKIRNKTSQNKNNNKKNKHTINSLKKRSGDFSTLTYKFNKEKNYNFKKENINRRNKTDYLNDFLNDYKSENRSEIKYKFNYYGNRNRNLNCKACNIGINNSLKGFSPLIYTHNNK